MLQYTEFVKEVKKQGVKTLYRDVTVYTGGKKFDTVLYALKGTGRSLVGYYSSKNGGTVTTSAQWSASGRKFDKIKI